MFPHLSLNTTFCVTKRNTDHSHIHGLCGGGDLAVVEEEQQGDVAVLLEEEEQGEEKEDAEEAFIPHDIHEMEGLRLVGGVDLINVRTAVFCDLPLRRILNSDERCRAYLQFRQQALQIAATELVSSYNSPVRMTFHQIRK